MLDHLSPQRRRVALAAVLLVVAVVVAAGALVAVRSLGGADPVAQDEPGPVLLVTGYGGRVESLAPVADALEAAGRDVTVVAPDGGGTGDLRAQAGNLDDAADAAMERTGDASVDVVGYSAGGVVARLWVRDEGGAGKARRVVTLGSPHHGTDVAALAAEVAGSCPRACEQLAPDSDLLRALNAGDETPEGPAWVTVRSRADRVVVPTDSARLDGALDVELQAVCPGSTTPHGSLPGDPVTLATLAAALGAAAPSVPADVSC